MCFSATASLTAGGLLSLTGIATLKKAKDNKRNAFAAIPLIFGIQQITEGILWLSLENKLPEEFGFVSTSIFCSGFMAFLVALFNF